MNKKILEWPHKKLATQCDPIPKIDDAIKQLAEDLIDTCNIMMGAGLAAPQIGVLKRMIVLVPANFGLENPDPCEYNPDFFVAINPVLETSGGSIKWKESCLSVPFAEGNVERKTNCCLSYMNLSGEMKSTEFGWPFAGVLQHECDHLDGIVYIHRQSRGNRMMTLKKYNKEKKMLNRSVKRMRRGV